MKYGELQSGVYRKLVNERNIVRKWDSWGLDYEDFKSLPVGTEIRLYDRDSKNLYTTSYEDAYASKTVAEFGEFGKQVFIPLSAFTRTKHG